MANAFATSFRQVLSRATRALKRRTALLTLNIINAARQRAKFPRVNRQMRNESNHTPSVRPARRV